jgi:hypothetical protein
MRVTYGFVYYFCLAMIAMTVSLSIFAIRSLRKKFFDYLKKIRLMDNFIIQSIVYISFFVIFIILIDSIWTYFSFKRNLEAGTYFNYERSNRLEGLRP